MLVCPTSSPKITRMFGRCPAGAAGCCACTGCACGGRCCAWARAVGTSRAPQAIAIAPTIVGPNQSTCPELRSAFIVKFLRFNEEFPHAVSLSIFGCPRSSWTQVQCSNASIENYENSGHRQKIKTCRYSGPRRLVSVYSPLGNFAPVESAVLPRNENSEGFP